MSRAPPLVWVDLLRTYLRKGRTSGRRRQAARPWCGAGESLGTESDDGRRTRRSGVDDESTDDRAVAQVLVALVELVKGVALGDQLVELELAGVVQPQKFHDLVLRVAGAELRSADHLLVAHEEGTWDLDGHLLRVRLPGDHQRAGLADDVEGVGDDLLVDDSDGHDRDVGALPPGELLDLRGSLRRVGEGMRGAEFERGLELELDRVDRHHELGSGIGRSLHGIGPDAPDAVDHDGVSDTDTAGVDRAAPPGGNAAAHERRGFEGDPLVDLHHRVLRDGGPLGEGAEHAEAAVVPSLTVVAEPAVEEIALHEVDTEIAEVLVARGAVTARPTTGDEAADDVVA